MRAIESLYGNQLKIGGDKPWQLMYNVIAGEAFQSTRAMCCAPSGEPPAVFLIIE